MLESKCALIPRTLKEEFAFIVKQRPIKVSKSGIYNIYQS